MSWTPPKTAILGGVRQAEGRMMYRKYKMSLKPATNKHIHRKNFNFKWRNFIFICGLRQKPCYEKPFRNGQSWLTARHPSELFLIIWRSQFLVDGKMLSFSGRKYIPKSQEFRYIFGCHIWKVFGANCGFELAGFHIDHCLCIWIISETLRIMWSIII